MNIDDLWPGVRVRVTDLKRPAGLIVQTKYLGNRQEGVLGTVLSPVAEHTHAWWVKQDNGKTAPYWYCEMTLEPNLVAEPDHPDPFKGRPF